MHPYPGYAPDPFAKVRSLGGTLFAFLIARASMRAVSYLVMKIAAPPPGRLTEEQFDTLRVLDGSLLGIENLLTAISMILFLVWIHRVYTAVRATGGTTAYSPGMAVGGWFIPVANMVLPWLTVRGALRAVQRPSALAGLWWLLWLANISLTMIHQLPRQLFLVPELGRSIPVEALEPIFELLEPTFWPYVLADTGTWALLAIIVHTVRAAVRPRNA